MLRNEAILAACDIRPQNAVTLKTCEPTECLNLHRAITVNHCTAVDMWGSWVPPPASQKTQTMFDRACDCSVMTRFF